MVKRIYWETIKKWALITGIPIGTAGFVILFMYLSALGVINVTSYSGDSICAGTLEDPCLAYINFSVKEDIFLYPMDYDPWGRDTPFSTDVEIESWKMYRSWGNGWREIKLNDTCTGTWCGAPNNKGVAYSFVFREGRDYQIKIEVLKKNPEEIIKWGFGPVDPTFMGYNKTENKVFLSDATLKLDTDTNNYIIRGANRTVAEFTIENNEDYLDELVNDLELFDIKDDMKEFDRKVYFRYKNFYEEEVYDYEIVCQEREVWNEINKNNSIEKYDCINELVGSHIEQKFNWIDFDEKSTLPKGNITIGIVTDVYPDEHVEWIPTIMKIRMPQFAEWTESLNVDLVLYYNMDDNIATPNVIDSHGNYNGTFSDVTGNPNTDAHSVAGIVNTALEFDATDDYINTSLASTNWSAGVSYAGWVYIESFYSTYQFLIGHRDSTGGQSWSSYIDYGGSNVWEFYIITDGGNHDAISDVVLPTGVWTHIAVNYNISSTDVIFYVNGSVADTVDTPGGVPSSVFNLGFTIGTDHAGGREFYGDVDEIGIWNRSLSQEEVTQLYNEGNGITYTIEITPPNVTINTPLNQTYNTKTIVFNVTALDNLEMKDCNYTLNSGVDNFTMSNVSTSPTYWTATNTTMSEGGHKVIYHCWDISGNLNDSESVSFFIDSIKPVVSFDYPENTTYVTEVNAINYTYFEVNCDSVKYSLNGGATNSSPVSCGTNFTSVTSSEGSSSWTLYINDSIGNANQSSVTFFQDSINPKVEINYPTNNTNWTNVNLDVNYTRSDTNLGSCWYSNDTYLKNTTLASCGNVTNVVWSEGNHNVTVWVNDTLGNGNSSRISFRIDTTPPVTTSTMTSPPGGVEYVNGTWTANNIQIKLDSVDTGVGFDSTVFPRYCTSSLNCNPNTWINAGVNISVENISYIRFNASDYLENAETIKSRTFKIDKTNPKIEIVTPSNNTNHSSTIIDVNFTRSDTLSGVGYCWYSNGTYGVNKTLTDCANITLITWGEGHQNVTIWVNDSVGNENSSNIHFTIDTTKPQINITSPLNNSNSTDVNLNVTYTSFDILAESFWWSNDTMTVNHSLGIFGNSWNITNITWNLGQHNVTVWVNDSAGNENYSSITFWIYEITESFLTEIELGTPVNITASADPVVMSIDIDHPLYGDNYNCSAIVSAVFEIDWFRKTVLANGSSFEIFDKTFYNFTSEDYENISYINISSHQYDEVVNMSLNMSGNGVDNIIFSRVNNITLFDRAYHGALRGNEIVLNRTIDNEWTKNLSYPVAGEQYIYFYIDDNYDLKNFTFNVSGWEYGFFYYNDFDNFSDIERDLTNASIKGAIIIGNTSNLTELVYDDFEDGNFANVIKWFKTANYSGLCFSPNWQCDIYGMETGGYYEMHNQLAEQMSGSQSGAATLSNDLWNNRSSLNLYTSDRIKINLSYDYSGGQRNGGNNRCSGYANLSIAGAQAWLSLLKFGFEIEDLDQSEYSTSDGIYLDIQKQENASWLVEISGTERSYGTNNGVCGPYSLEYNWTTGTWHNHSVSCPDSNGTLDNSFYITPNYRTYLPTRPIRLDVDLYAYYDEETNIGCFGNQFNLKVYYVNQSKSHISNGTVTSKSVFDSSSDIISAKMGVGYYIPPGEIFELWLSADDGENWENVTNNVEYNFANPGRHIKWRIDYKVNDNIPFVNETTFIVSVNLTTNKGFPSNISFDFGDDGIFDFNIPGTINQTNGTFIVDLSQANLSAAFTSLRSLYDHLYEIPLRVTSDTLGLILIDSINLTYDPNPIRLNISAIQDYLSDSSGYTNFSIPIGSVGGQINISNIRYDYAGGNETINVTIHTIDYSYVNQTNITFWYSSWKYNLPYDWTYAILFLPTSNNSKNVSAYGQTISTPIYNITTTNYGGRNLNFSVRLKESNSCLNITWNSTGSFKPNGFVLNTSWQEVSQDLEYLNNTKIWLWADLKQCNPSDNWALRPEIQIESYCVGCSWGN